MFYRVFFHYFELFLREYEDRFEREYGYFRPVIEEVVEKYLDCGNPMCGFARIARVTSHIPDKGQVIIRYYGLYSNSHPSHPPIIEDDPSHVPSKALFTSRTELRGRKAASASCCPAGAPDGSRGEWGVFELAVLDVISFSHHVIGWELRNIVKN